MFAATSSTVPVIITIIGGVFGIAGLLGGALAIVRSNLAKTTIDLWKGEAEAQKARIETLEGDKTRLETEIARLNTKLVAVERENEVLGRRVTGEIAIAKLQGIIVEQHTQQMTQYDLLIETLQKLSAAMDRIANGTVDPN